MFSERYVVTKIMRPFLQAMSYLHRKGIVHRDIKPENIFMAGRQMVLKVGDFGLSIEITKERPVTRAGEAHVDLYQACV